MSTQEANRPVHTIRYGRIKATIWANQTQKGTMHNVTITRSYQDDQQNWHDTDSFGVSDLMTVAKAAFDAHTWISMQQRYQRFVDRGVIAADDDAGDRETARAVALATRYRLVSCRLARVAFLYGMLRRMVE